MSPVHVRESINKLSRTRSELTQELGREPTLEKTEAETN